jgi:hypothetical protein
MLHKYGIEDFDDKEKNLQINMLKFSTPSLEAFRRSCSELKTTSPDKVHDQARKQLIREITAIQCRNEARRKQYRRRNSGDSNCSDFANAGEKTYMSELRSLSPSKQMSQPKKPKGTKHQKQPSQH